MSLNLSRVTLSFVLFALGHQVLAYSSGENVFRFKLPGSGTGTALLAPGAPGSRWGTPGPAWTYVGASGVLYQGAGQPVSVSFEFQNAVDGATQLLNSDMSRASFGQLARNRIFTPSNSLGGAVDAAGYTLDPGTQDVYAMVDPYQGAVGGCYLGHGTYARTAEGCLADITAKSPTVGWVYSSFQVDRYNINPAPGNNNVFGWWTPPYVPPTGYQPGDTQPQPLNNDELADWAFGYLTAAERNALFSDPNTGAPYDLPEVQPLLDSLNGN